MEKNENSKIKDAKRHIGKKWRRLPEQDVRTASGVIFGGKYMTDDEYHVYCRRRGIKP